MAPFPSFKPPCQAADPCLLIFMSRSPHCGALTLIRARGMRMTGLIDDETDRDGGMSRLPTSSTILPRQRSILRPYGNSAPPRPLGDLGDVFALPLVLTWRNQLAIRHAF